MDCRDGDRFVGGDATSVTENAGGAGIGKVIADSFPQ